MAARIRTVKPEFWQDELIGSLPMGAQLLYLGLISHADDEGRLRGSPLLIRAQVFPYRLEAEVEEWLALLAEANRIVRYVVDGQSYIAIPRFTDHQRIEKPKKSALPVPQKRAIRDESRTRPGHVDDASGTHPGRNGMEGNGMEWKGMEATRTEVRVEVVPVQEILVPVEPDSDPRPTRVFDHWRKVMGKTNARTVFNEKRKEAVARALKTWREEELLQAIDGCAASPFHMGENEDSKRYDDLELICRDDARIEKFIEMAREAKPSKDMPSGCSVGASCGRPSETVGAGGARLCYPHYSDWQAVWEAAGSPGGSEGGDWGAQHLAAWLESRQGPSRGAA